MVDADSLERTNWLTEGPEPRACVTTAAGSRSAALCEGRVAGAGGPGGGPKKYVRPHGMDMDNAKKGCITERGSSRSQALSPDFDNPFSIAGDPTRDQKH